MIRQYVQNKIDELINEIKNLSMIAKTEPQAAYFCLNSTQTETIIHHDEIMLVGFGKQVK